MRDNLFETRPIPPGEFHFGPPVADVFDDMVVRSVPQYEVVQDLLADLALRCCAGRPIYDLGCSTGTTLLWVARRAAAPLTLVGIDRSEAMLLRCREKLAEAAASHDIHLENQDLETAFDFAHGTPGAIVLCLVLQFLPPRAPPGSLATGPPAVGARWLPAGGREDPPGRSDAERLAD